MTVRTRFILASASPRRQELIELFGQPWQVQAAAVDEESIADPDPVANVIQTAELKAVAVAEDAPTNAIVIAADTTVALDNQMLNKPENEADARLMLRRLRGRTHQVHTGIAVIDIATGRTVTDVATIDVPMRDYSDAEIESYVTSGDPLDKAGAYAIQHPGFRPVVGLSGCYSGVMGLPLCHLMRALRRLGFSENVDIAAACQDYHSYDCPVYSEILQPQ